MRGEKQQKKGNNRTTPEKEPPFVLSWLIPRLEFPGIILRPYSIFISKYCSGSIKKKSAKAQELFHFMRSTGLQKICSSWLLYRKSNWNNNFRAAVEDLDGELQQTSGKRKQGGATKREKKVSSWVLKLKTVNYRYQLNLKWVSTQFEITIKSGYIVEYFYEAIIGTKPFLIFNPKCDYILWIAIGFCKAWTMFRACS